MNAETGFAHPAAPGIDDPWAGFSNPRTAQEFISSWFSVLLSEIAEARAAILLLEHRDGGFAPAALWPVPEIEAEPLRALAQRAAADPERTLFEIAEDGTRLIAYPVAVDGSLHAIVALSAGQMSRAGVERALRRLHWGAGWLHSLVLKQRGLDADSARRRATAALEILAAIEDEPGLEAALRSLANEILVRLSADRVSIALMGARRLAIRAVSETSDAERRSSDMRQLRQALEESRLQTRTLVFPAPETDTISILAAHRAHARKAGVSAMVSTPIRLGGEILGVLGAERMGAHGETPRPFSDEEVALLEAILASTAPVVRFKRRAHRLVAGRLPELVGKGWKKLFGPRHPVLKLAVGLSAAGLAFLALTPAPLHLDARAVVLGSEQRAVVSPFEGYVATAPLRAGDWVAEGDVIATLDDADLRLDAMRWQSELARLNQERRQMLAGGDRVGVALADARATSARAELELVQSRLERVRLLAPFDGLIVSGDLSQRLGAPVGQGEVLFEIAHGEAHKAVLDIGEYDIALVEAGAAGHLALMGLSGDPIPITLSHIGPVAEIGRGANVFKAEADLPAGLPGLRPGLEGTAKIEAGRASWLSVLTRPLLVRLRYLLWQWSP